MRNIEFDYHDEGGQSWGFPYHDGQTQYQISDELAERLERNQKEFQEIQNAIELEIHGFYRVFDEKQNCYITIEN